METDKESKAIRPRGGKREGAGRKPGVRNKRTSEQIAAIEASGMTPLEYMLQVMRNPQESASARLNAAGMAAPYVHAKLSSVEMNGSGGGPILHTFEFKIVDPAG